MFDKKRAVGPAIGGIIAGALTFLFSVSVFIVVGLSNNRINLFEYPPQPKQTDFWRDWENWGIALGLVVGLATAILVSRSLYKDGLKQRAR